MKKSTTAAATADVTVAAAIDGNPWNVGLLYFFCCRLVRKYNDNILSNREF